MRIGEASALCWKDYDRKLKQFQSQNLIIKNKFGPTKNKENRIIFISNELANELFKLKTLQNGNKIANSDFYNNSYDYIFCNEFGEPLPRSTTHNTMMYVTKNYLVKEMN